MILMSHPTGNANVRAVADALLRHGMLLRFATCIGISPQSPLAQRFPQRIFNLPPDKMWTHPQREIVRHLASRFGVRGIIEHERGWASMDQVGRDLDRYVAKKLEQTDESSLTGVYCYEDFALATFEAAKRRQLRRVYDLPIAYWEVSQRLLREQAERWPAWEPTLGGTRDSAEKLERKRQELELSDVVITPSKFVFDTLPAAVRERKKVVVAEFGSPEVSSLTSVTRAPSSRPLRVLFAGAMTQRKGLADVFAAMKLVDSKAVELVVIGSPVSPISFYRGELADFRYEAPREHRAMLELMQSCDVLVLPSIVEGRALVQQEALACGLPLIVTRNAGGEDLIDEGETGFLVPPNSPESIAQKITWFVAHRGELPRMSAAARAKAAERTWRDYGEKVVHAIAA